MFTCNPSSKISWISDELKNEKLNEKKIEIYFDKSCSVLFGKKRESFSLRAQKEYLGETLRRMDEVMEWIKNGSSHVSRRGFDQCSSIIVYIYIYIGICIYRDQMPTGVAAEGIMSQLA